MTRSPDLRRAAVMQKRADILRAASFKPVAAGYIYRAPKPWVFGRPEHYLVSAAQRDAIIEILVPQTPTTTPVTRLTRLMVISAVAFSVALLTINLLFLFSVQYPALTTLAGVASVLTVSLLATTLTILHRLALLQLARLRPILASATAITDRISNDDVLWAARTGGDRKSRRRVSCCQRLDQCSRVLGLWCVGSYLSWRPGEGFFSYLQLFFMLAAAAIFGIQAAFNYYCARSERLPESARKIDKFFKRTILGGALAFVAIALVYAGLLSTGIVSPDFVAAHARFERSAMAGDAEAMSRLAAQFRDGRGGPQDYVKAREWFEKAAATGDAKAMFWVGWLHQKGFGGAQDLALARHWFERAAAKGDGAAMSWLGANAQFGTGVAKDLAQARAWYEKAAAAGNSSGMNNLATLFVMVGRVAGLRQGPRMV